MFKHMSFVCKVIMVLALLAIGRGIDLYAGPPALSLDELVGKVEQRYSLSGFRARFDQQSTIKAMDITDSASGTIYVKRPDKMRWEYDAPEQQTVVTDGKTLWIYRQEDHQVMVGKAPEYFGGGRGAVFLSDIETIRSRFTLTLEAPDGPDYRVKMIPLEKAYDLAQIYLTISADTFDIVEIDTYNTYQDRTRITMSHIVFDDTLSDSLFTFVIPEGTDVLELEE